MADKNQWMLDAGLRVVRGWGKRIGGYPASLKGTMYEVELSDGSFHQLVNGVVWPRPLPKHGSRHEPLYGLSNYFSIMPENIMADSLRAELDNEAFAQAKLHELRSASAKRGAATRRRNKEASNS
jgi:hypothetical protein